MCGVFGVVLPSGRDAEAAQIAALGLFALQHRGQESAGIAVSDGRELMLYKDLGMIATVLDERRLPSLRGNLAIAHCRYSTTGSTVWENAQPTFRLGPRRAVAIGHNGNLVNTRELLGQLRGGRTRLPASTDTELLTALLADEPAADTVDALVRVLPRVHGAYSLVVLDERRVIGVRDPFGFRPLVLGRLPAPDAVDGALEPGLWGDDDAGAGWILSSETTGLDIVGAEFVRDVEPGEIVVLEPGREPRSVRFAEREAGPVRLRADLLRPTGLVHGGPQPLRGPPADGDAAGRRASGRDRPRHARPGHRRSGGRRLRRAVRHPVPRGPGPESLHRPDVHPAVPDAAPPRRHDQAQPAPRGRPRAAADRRRRFDRPRHDDQADRAPSCARRARPRSTSGSARRRSTTRASTGSTRRSRPSSSRRPTRPRRSASSSAPIRSATCRSPGSSPRSTCRTTGSASPASTATTRSPSRTTLGSRKFMLEEEPVPGLALPIAPGSGGRGDLRRAYVRRASTSPRASGPSSSCASAVESTRRPGGRRRPRRVRRRRRDPGRPARSAPGQRDGRGRDEDRDRDRARPVRHDRASTSWRCARTTSSAPAPSRSFFLDYVAVGRLVPGNVAELVGGVAAGCPDRRLRPRRR